MSIERQTHWNEVYATKGADKVSWFQPRAEMSMRLIEAAGATKDSAIIDIGGGSSVLIDHLLDAGFVDVTALDISERALIGSKDRLGPARPRCIGSSMTCSRGLRRAPTTSGTTARYSISSRVNATALRIARRCSKACVRAAR